MSNIKQESQNKHSEFLGRLWLGFKSYLTDWRNLLGHASLGVILLVLAIWVPIQIWFKLLAIAALITLNILRMRCKTQKANIKK